MPMNPKYWQPLLTTKELGRHVIYENEMTSTNTVLKAAALDGAPHGTVAICNRQTAGRGRMNRVWDASGKHGYLTVSLLIRPKIDTAQAPLFTLLAGLSMAKAMEQLGVPPQIKWPNDLVINGKKVCGILCEMIGDAVIIGTGVNVSSHPKELDATATHLRLYKTILSDHVLSFYLNQMEEDLFRFEKQGFVPFIKDYEDRCITLNRKVQIIGNETYIAKAIGIDPTGCLVVQDELGKERLVSFGDVSVRGVMGYV